MRLTNVQGQEITCGSTVSNNRGQNRALVENQYKGNETSTEFVYPFKEKCYSTFKSGLYREEPLPDKDGFLLYKKSDRILNSATGFVNSYDGSGFQKVVPLNMTDENFFQKMYQEEIIN